MTKATTIKVGWIGTGVMGVSMAGHLLAAGHELRLYTRTRAKAQPLLDRGARWAASPAEVSAGADILCTMVGYPEEVREVVLGSDGVLASAPAGSLLIDFTTSRPELAVEIHRAAAVRGIGSLDAPVSGGDVGARNAALSIMVGGDRADFDRARPVLELLGSTIIHQGPAGSGQHTKMVNQTIIAGTMIGICEALMYAQRSGLDPDTVLQSVGGGAASSWALENLWPRMMREDYEAGFFVEHFIKDMGIALDECRRMGLELPGLKLAHDLYTRLAGLGHARAGTQALILALEEMNRES